MKKPHCCNVSISPTLIDTRYCCENVHYYLMTEIPTTPLNFAVCRVERTSGGGSVTIMASWMRPQNYEQFDIDHYNLNVSSTSGIQQVSLQENGDSTTAVLTVSENPNNVQLNTTFTVTITATSQCGETSSSAAASFALSELLHLTHVAV